VREGWGLVVTQANAMGTPAIGYDVLGLRVSTRYDETGINVIEKSPGATAQQAIWLFRDPKRLSNYSKKMHLNIQGNLPGIRLWNHFRNF
jgi:glycosyltransferase involved in cell wall biosynthesis